MEFRTFKSKDICNILLKWLQTLHLKSPHQTLNDISDGVALAEALNKMSPKYFNGVWFSTIKKEVGCDNRQKVSNLKNIVEKIDEFNQKLHTQLMGNFMKPDVVQIVEQSDTIELARLLQHIVVVAINCRNIHEFITHIRSRDENLQHVIMLSTKYIERNTTYLTDDIAHQERIQHRNDQLQGLRKARDQMNLSCQQLDSHISLLQDAKKNFLEKKIDLEAQLFREDSLKCNGQKMQIQELKEEISEAETSRDDYRIKLETQERELVEMKSKYALLHHISNNEAIKLYNNLEIFLEPVDKVRALDLSLIIIKTDSFTKKFEKLRELKEEKDILKNKYKSCTQQNMELEQEIKKASAWKSQFEMIKNSVTALHQELNRPNPVDELKYKTLKLMENLNTLQKEKDILVTVREDLLKEANEELKCCQTQTQLSNTIDHSQAGKDIESAMDLKQELVTLQHDNTMLKINQEQTHEAKVSLLQLLIDNTRQLFNELHLDNRRANHRILELLSKSHGQTEKNIVELNSKVKELQIQLQFEKDKRSWDMEEKNSIISDQDQYINELQLFHKHKRQRKL